MDINTKCSIDILELTTDEQLTDTSTVSELQILSTVPPFVSRRSNNFNKAPVAQYALPLNRRSKYSITHCYDVATITENTATFNKQENNQVEDFLYEATITYNANLVMPDKDKEDCANDIFFTNDTFTIDDRVDKEKIKQHVENTKDIILTPSTNRCFNNKKNYPSIEQILSTIGRYKSLTFIAEGGQGKVYKAWDSELDQEVAIKILPESYSKNKLLIDNLRKEVVISRRLRYPGIGAVHDLITFTNGLIGFVMDYIEGCSLSSWLKQEGKNRWKWTEKYLEMLRVLSYTLSVAHNENIVHRDIKPGNVMLKDGKLETPVLLDFGIALPSIDSPDNKKCGTFHYMAPEQWERPHEVDGRSDLFAFGILAYLIFTGKLPPCSLYNFPKIRKVPCVPVEEISPLYNYNARVPASLDQLIRSLLSYEPENRPLSANELYNQLKDVSIIDEQEALFKHLAKKNKISKDGFVTIAKGHFYLGSERKECGNAERPKRRVFLSEYRISINLITNRVYREFLESTGFPFPTPPWLDHSVIGKDEHPVVGITWDEAMTFCQWMGGLLPTEAQWEKAAKGIDSRTYPWGDEFSNTKANIDFFHNATTSVGLYPEGASPYGCLDMAGNVREWCLDWYDPQSYSKIPMGGKDPQGPFEGKHKVMRGGGFRSYRDEARCSFRGHASVDTREPDIGFRIVLSNEELND